jgi:single-stranded-DNA-specific exonuclease
MCGRNRSGADVVIIDHHQRQEQTPAAAAILWEPRYCVSGLAMMTAWALLDAERGTERAARTAESLSKLAAIATIADCIPLFGAGRTLTQIGLANLARNTHAGLSRLLEVSGIQPGATPTSRQIGFMLAPRLNSAGRMGSPNDALAVFLEPDPAVAIETVNRLDELNSQRRELQKSLCKQMIEQTTDVADVCGPTTRTGLTVWWVLWRRARWSSSEYPALCWGWTRQQTWRLDRPEAFPASTWSRPCAPARPC